MWQRQIQTTKYFTLYFDHLHPLILILKRFWCPKWFWQKFCHKKAALVLHSLKAMKPINLTIYYYLTQSYFYSMTLAPFLSKFIGVRGKKDIRKPFKNTIFYGIWKSRPFLLSSVKIVFMKVALISSSLHAFLKNILLKNSKGRRAF